MKKLIVAAMVIVAACALSSCETSCTCKEKTTGVSTTQKISGTTYTSCSALQSGLNDAAKGTGLSYSCTKK